MTADMIPTTKPCADCHGSGRRVYERRTQRFFDPFETYDGDCETCDGEGWIEVDADDAESVEKREAA